MDLCALTMSQGLIILIPKTDKDHRYLDNLRPITLLNNDYKIFTHVLVNRLKEGINGVINEVQSGFLKRKIYSQQCKTSNGYS